MIGADVELLVTERLPSALPAVVGLKVTVTETLRPAATVAGSVRFAKLKAVPVTASCVMERFAVPTL